MQQMPALPRFAFSDSVRSLILPLRGWNSTAIKKKCQTKIVRIVSIYSGVERKAASRYLHQLEDLGILKSHKIGWENVFVNNALMEILSQA